MNHNLFVNVSDKVQLYFNEDFAEVNCYSLFQMFLSLLNPSINLVQKLSYILYDAG